VGEGLHVNKAGCVTLSVADGGSVVAGGSVAERCVAISKSRGDKRGQLLALHILCP
jgi:hypothetical protein